MDNTGKLFTGHSLYNQNKGVEKKIFEEKGLLICAECRREEFYVFADVNGPFMQIICKCGNRWPIVEIHKPQMTEGVATRAGIAVPKLGELDPAIDAMIEE